jgi:hypothetical protein
MELQQIRFSIQSVAFQIDAMLDAGKHHLFYSSVFDGDQLYGPGILRKHLLGVVISLQEMYRGRCVVSRSPGGIVVHTI